LPNYSIGYVTIPARKSYGQIRWSASIALIRLSAFCAALSLTQTPARATKPENVLVVVNQSSALSRNMITTR
jgi:hypothetical protein